MTRRRALRAALLASASLALAAPEARAGAFQIREGSAAAQGASFAGRTSGDRDVSYALHNPAALRSVETLEMSLGAAGIIATGDAEAEASVPGFESTGDPNEIALVPSTAFGWRAHEQVVFGLAIDAPFGLATKYDDDFVGSFDGVESELVNIAVTPLVAVQPTQDFAIGAGLTLSYADAKLTNRTARGEVSSLEGDDFAFGFTIGALFDVVEGTTLGLAFQSGVSHTLEGDLSDNYFLPNPAAPNDPAQAIGVGGPGEAGLDLPFVLSVGLTQAVTETARVMAEAEYVGWSSFESIDIFSETLGATFSEEQNYDNSFMLAVGGEYDVTDTLTLRTGVAWDQSPTSDAWRTVRVPDADRVWISAGASWDVTDAIGVDVAYSYLHFMDASVELRNGPAAGSTVNYNDSAAHIVGINGRYRW